MTRFTRLTITLGALLTVAVLTTVPGRSEQLPRLNELMRQKLDHAQQVLEAVVLGQYVSIERYAHELELLSEASTWSPMQTPEYLHYAADFREAARGLAQEARDRDIDGVSLAYMELTMTCVQCHKHVRGSQRAD